MHVLIINHFAINYPKFYIINDPFSANRFIILY